MNKLLIPYSLVFLLILPLVGVAATPSTPAQEKKDNEYTITVIPFYSPEKIWALYSPLVDFLRETTGKPWELKLYSSHDTIIEGLCSGKVSLALLGPVPLGRVMQQCKAEPVLVALGKDGKPFYRSVVITSDPSVTSLAELRGKRFALFKGSTAAHILPRKLLRDAGLSKNDFIQVFYDSQDHIINALLNREVSAAGVKDNLYKKFQNERLRQLQSSEPLPNFAFVAAPTLDAGTRKLFANTLLALNPTTNANDKKRMEPWDDEIRNGFIVPSADFLSSAKGLVTLTNEVMSEDR